MRGNEKETESFLEYDKTHHVVNDPIFNVNDTLEIHETYTKPRAKKNAESSHVNLTDCIAYIMRHVCINNGNKKNTIESHQIAHIIIIQFQFMPGNPIQPKKG